MFENHASGNAVTNPLPRQVLVEVRISTESASAARAPYAGAATKSDHHPILSFSATMLDRMDGRIPSAHGPLPASVEFAHLNSNGDSTLIRFAKAGTGNLPAPVSIHHEYLGPRNFVETRRNAPTADSTPPSIERSYIHIISGSFIGAILMWLYLAFA